MSKLKKTLLAMALLPVLGLVTPATVEATPITGTVYFSGTGTWTGGVNYLTATGLDFSNPIGITEDISTGAYAGLQPGTTATFTDLTGGSSFGAPGTVGALSVAPLWTFVDAGTGWTYAFNLVNVTFNAVSGSSRVVEGTGTATITGSGSPYDTSEGTWSLSTTGSGTTIQFSASSQVPDGGLTMVLLGATLLGFGLLRRRFRLN